MPAWVFQGNKEHFQELLSIPAEPECFPAVPRGCTQDRLSSQPGCWGGTLGPSQCLTPNPVTRLREMFVLQKSPQRRKGLSKASGPGLPLKGLAASCPAFPE